MKGEKNRGFLSLNSLPNFSFFLKSMINKPIMEMEICLITICFSFFFFLTICFSTSVVMNVVQFYAA